MDNRKETIKFSETFVDSEDLNYLIKQIKNLPNFSERAAFIFNFIGQIGLSNFCKIVAGSAISDNSTNSLMPTNLLLFWKSSFFRV